MPIARFLFLCLFFKVASCYIELTINSFKIKSRYRPTIIVMYKKSRPRWTIENLSRDAIYVFCCIFCCIICCVNWAFHENYNFVFFFKWLCFCFSTRLIMQIFAQMASPLTLFQKIAYTVGIFPIFSRMFRNCFLLL